MICTLVSEERSRNRRVTGSVLALLSLTLCGCAPSPGILQQGIGVRPATLRTAPPSSASVANPVQVALARVHAQPLYREAEAACREKRFGSAANLLARLATLPDLDADAKAFVQQQRAVCLRDANLPAPNVSFPRRSPTPAPLCSAVAVSSDQADCGPRALLLVCRQLSVSASLPQLRQWAGTTVQGTSMAGLAKAAKAEGLKAEGVQVSREALPEQDMPAIAYVNNNHFVAVLSLQGSGDSGKAIIHDPNSAEEETIPQERLLRLCSGYLLLLRR